MSNDARSILINTSYLGLARIATSLSRAVYALLLAKYLGPELYGLYNYGLSWYLYFLPISFLGTQWVVSHDIGRNPQDSQLIINNTYTIRLLSAVAAGIICILFYVVIDKNTEFISLIITFSVALSFRSFVMWQQSIFVAKENTAPILKLETLFRMSEVLLGSLFLINGANIIQIAALHSTAWIIQSVITQKYLRKLFGSIKFQIQPKQIKYVLSRGAPFAVSALFASWILQGPTILFKHTFGVTDSLGYLALALQAFTILSMISGELGNAALPVLARFAQNNNKQTASYVLQVVRIGWIFGAILCLSGISIGETIIEMFFGPNYQPTAKLLPWSLFSVTFYFWMTALQGLVGIHGHFKNVIINNFFGFLVFTASCLYLIPRLGGLGAIVGLASGLFTISIFHLIILKKCHGFKFFNLHAAPAIIAIFSIMLSYQLEQYSAILSLIVGLVIILFGLAFIYRKTLLHYYVVTK